MELHIQAWSVGGCLEETGASQSRTNSQYGQGVGHKVSPVAEELPATAGKGRVSFL